MQEIHRKRVGNLVKEEAAMNIELIKSRLMHIVDKLERAKKSLDEGSSIPVGEDFGNMLIEDLKKTMNKTYDLFVEEPDEYTVGPMPIQS